MIGSRLIRQISFLIGSLILLWVVTSVASAGSNMDFREQPELRNTAIPLLEATPTPTPVALPPALARLA